MPFDDAYWSTAISGLYNHLNGEERTAVRIKETIERECCQSKDLKDVHGSPKIGVDSTYKFCVHCGATHKFSRYMDAAGSSDWEYRKVELAKLDI